MGCALHSEAAGRHRLAAENRPRACPFVEEAGHMTAAATKATRHAVHGMKKRDVKQQPSGLGRASRADSDSGGHIRRMSAALHDLPKNVALALITFYRTCISPLTPPSCRYYPTCSEYALLSFKRFGFVKGLYLTARRISRCHPFHPGGYDPVPELDEWPPRHTHRHRKRHT